MRILHTSDWHIGRRLKEHDRSGEFREFFSWLKGIIAAENIDVLLVSGDIFDNTTPSVAAQNIYYSFLCDIAKSSCRHTVIISGNHDSPAFLDAPSELLKLSRIHVIGCACADPADEVLTLTDTCGRPELIVCAVPYLRDRDVRVMTDTPEDSSKALAAGIRAHYAAVFARAEELRGEHQVPVIAMGHMFVRGGHVRPDEGVRSLYVGTAPEIGSDIFPEFVSYTALGHLHSPQSIGRDNVRYSGSPIAMTFGEADGAKSVYILELDGENMTLRDVAVPVFQRLERISGSMDNLEAQITELGHSGESIWLEVTHNVSESIGDLQERLNAAAKPFDNLEILSVYDVAIERDTDRNSSLPQGLDNVKPLEMLELCFDSHDTPQEQRDIFRPMYQEILQKIGVDF